MALAKKNECSYEKNVSDYMIMFCTSLVWRESFLFWNLEYKGKDTTSHGNPLFRCSPAHNQPDGRGGTHGQLGAQAQQS